MMDEGPERDLVKGIPDPDAVLFCCQKMFSTNPDIYKEGFDKMMTWCKAEPDWVTGQGALPMHSRFSFAKSTVFSRAFRAMPPPTTRVASR
jgi:hypothetical protein